ncbi:hypothetical protein [Halomonas piscis]|uniref:hypothetical protein n=1 Tax=Halomonas piscis TaxID=3031727 RepID=UPI00289AF291|nr:hypothetical protein [Halomonas piscis]
MAKQYIDAVNVSTLQQWKVLKEYADPGEMAAIGERVLEPIAEGSLGKPWRHDVYTVSGDLGGKRCSFTLHEDGEPLAVIGVCLHSRASKPLLQALTPIPDDDGLSVPWMIIRMEQDTLPPWVERWAEQLAWAVVRRQEGDQ